VGDVVDAIAENQADRSVPGGQQGPEVLSREIAREGTSARRAVELALGMFDRRPDGNELGQLATPFVAADLVWDADDAVGPELIRFFLHPRHRQLPRVVHRLRQHVELLVRSPPA
jgi:hypothetical protein